MPVLLIPGTVFWTHEAEKYQNTSAPLSYHPPPLSTNEFIVRIVNILYCHLARSIQYLLNDGWDTRAHVCWACTGDNLHEIAKPIIWEKYHHFIIFWISPESGKGWQVNKVEMFSIYFELFQNIIFFSVLVKFSIVLTLLRLFLNTTCPVCANSAVPDQLASEASWPGSAVFGLDMWVSIKNQNQEIWWARN